MPNKVEHTYLDCYNVEAASIWGMSISKIAATVQSRLFLTLLLSSSKRTTDSSDGKGDIVSMLASARQHGSSDPRDKVFGLFSLLVKLDPNFPSPDYSKPVETVFTEVTRVCILHDQNLDVLYQIPSSTRIPKLPSWVPDWSRCGWVARGKGFLDTCKYIKQFGVATMAKACFRFSPNLQTLIVTGKIIDQIARRGASAPSCGDRQGLVLNKHLWQMLHPRYRRELATQIKGGRLVFLQ
jgi:hypothetical protein